MREVDLHHPVSSFLTRAGFIIRSEVQHCDIAAVRNGQLLVVELKLRVDLKLILQAAQRQRVADSVYIAVPRPPGGIHTRQWRHIRHLLRRLELGLMLVALNRSVKPVEVVFDPKPFAVRKNRRKRAGIFTEISGRSGEFNVGGSSRKKLMTAYRENCVFVACCLMSYGPMSAKKLREHGTGPKTHAILYQNYYGWFKRVERGIYELAPGAESQLNEHPVLLEMYLQKLGLRAAGVRAAGVRASGVRASGNSP